MMKISNVTAEFKPITVQVTVEERRELLALADAYAYLCVGTVAKDMDGGAAEIVVKFLEDIYAVIREELV